MKSYINAYLIFFSLSFCVGCSNAQKVKNESEFSDQVFGNVQEQFNIDHSRFYDEDSSLVFRTRWFGAEDEKVYFEERFDSTRNFLGDFRTITVSYREKNSTISRGDTLQASVYVYGPIPCDKVFYYITEPIRKDSIGEGVMATRINNDTNNRAFFEFIGDEPGEYFYRGAIAISCDTVSYPRQYNFEGEFTVIE